MDMYSFLRELADSWVLLLMVAFFLLAIVYTFRPGARERHRDSADIPFRYENSPISDTDPTGRKAER